MSPDEWEETWPMPSGRADVSGAGNCPLTRRCAFVSMFCAGVHSTLSSAGANSATYFSKSLGVLIGEETPLHLLLLYRVPTWQALSVIEMQASEDVMSCRASRASLSVKTTIQLWTRAPRAADAFVPESRGRPGLMNGLVFSLLVVREPLQSPTAENRRTSRPCRLVLRRSHRSPPRAAASLYESRRSSSSLGLSIRAASFPQSMPLLTISNSHSVRSLSSICARASSERREDMVAARWRSRCEDCCPKTFALRGFLPGLAAALPWRRSTRADYSRDVLGEYP